MALLTSPDPQIHHLLQTNLHLHEALAAWIAREKYVARKVLPGLFQRFLKSDLGEPFTHLMTAALPPSDAALARELVAQHPPAVPVQPFDDMTPVASLPAPAPTNGHAKPPLQEDLFGLLARGIQQHLGPQQSVLDEARVREMIDYALKSDALRNTYRVVIKQDDTVLRRVQTELPMPSWFPRVYKLALARVHVLLVGPRGCGKTTAGELLANALDLPFYPLSLSAGVDEGIMQGWLLPTAENLRFEYVRSKFVKAYTEGGVVLLDELDAADPNMLMIANSALANGHWDIPLRGEKAEPLIRHKDFVCLAAANTHGHGADRVYVGRNQLDGATLDRFAVGRLSVDYDEALEQAAYPREAWEFGQRLRARCRAQQGWTRDVSTRNIADTTKAMQYLSLEEAWYGYFEDWSEGDCAKVGAVRDRKAMTVGLE